MRDTRQDCPFSGVSFLPYHSFPFSNRHTRFPLRSTREQKKGGGNYCTSTRRPNTRSIAGYLRLSGSPHFPAPTKKYTRKKTSASRNETKTNRIDKVSMSIHRHTTHQNLEHSGQVEPPPTDAVAAAPLFRRRDFRKLLHPERHVVLPSVCGLVGVAGGGGHNIRGQDTTWREVTLVWGGALSQGAGISLGRGCGLCNIHIDICTLRRKDSAWCYWVRHPSHR